MRRSTRTPIIKIYTVSLAMERERERPEFAGQVATEAAAELCNWEVSLSSPLLQFVSEMKMEEYQ